VNLPVLVANNSNSTVELRRIRIVADDCIVHHGFIKLECIHNSRDETILNEK
jgi:hypothetical protein